MTKNSICKKRSLLRAIGLQLLSLVLISAMASPAFAVVFSNPAALTISDAGTIGVANPYPSQITVAGMTGTVTNVTATLRNLNHTFPEDLDIMLVAPGGNNLVIFSDAGGSNDYTNISMTFDDAAAAAVPDPGPLVSGTFKPSQYVTGDVYPAPAPAASANTTFAAAFNGINPNGTWSLYAVDDTGIDIGTFGDGWSLTITTTGTAATSFVNSTPIFLNDRWGRGSAYPSEIVVSGLTGAITDVNITFTNFNHLNPDDLDIMLVSPAGKRLLIWSDAGGTGDAVNVTLTLDDAAASALVDAGPIVAGTFRPANYGTGDTLHDLLPPYSSAGTGGTGTLASVFNGTEPNGTWKLYIVDDASASTGNFNGGWSLDITASGTYGAKRFTSSDFNGDGMTDVSVYRPSDSNWWWRSSDSYQNRVVKWGTANDVPIPSDYDGDNKTDFAVFRPSVATWFILNSATSTVSQVNWGISTDKLVPADYDGDGKVDIAIWRDGQFWVRQSSNAATRVVGWGTTGDVPVRGHFEGTNGADFAIFRPSTGTWWILNNAGNSSRAQQWGISSDRPVPADYDADGKTDLAVFRPSEGNWYVFNSASATALILHWGANGDTPVAGDYDGDSKADLAVWRGAEGGWYIINSGTPFGAAAGRTDHWGIPSDIALPGTYFP